MSAIYTAELDALLKEAVIDEAYDKIQELVQQDHAKWSNEGYCGDAVTLRDQVGEVLVEASVDMDVVIVMDALQVLVSNK